MKNIKELLPHREPFLFVDKLEKVSDDEIIGYHVYTDKEVFFKGHFPDYPVVPGVILLETMVQVGGAGIRLSNIYRDSLFFLASIEKAKFRRQVRPNEQARVVVKNLRITEKMLNQSGTIYIGNQIAAKAEWLCIVGDPL